MTTETPDLPPSTETPPAPAPAPLPSPGSMIREARARARRSLEDMAAHTKLARGTLEALERDDYAALLEPVYVRGYYRKCAKVLEMDEERLISAYQARVSPRPPEAPSKLRLASGTELGSSSRLPVSMAISAAVVAVVVCAFIWFARNGIQTYPVTPPTIEVIEPAPSVPLEQVMTEPLSVPEVVDAAPVAAEAPLEPPPAAAAAATAAPVTLRLRFTQTSWIRVDDAGGRTLLNDIRRAGSEENLTGQPPLSVFLGFAPGVEVEFDGRRIDVQPYLRANNTARFSVPQP